MPNAELGEIQLHYREYGEGSPLIMILGIGQDLMTWGFQVPEFSKYHRVIVFDNRDAGESSRYSGLYGKFLERHHRQSRQALWTSV